MPHRVLTPSAGARSPEAVGRPHGPRCSLSGGHVACTRSTAHRRDASRGTVRSRKASASLGASDGTAPVLTLGSQEASTPDRVSRDRPPPRAPDSHPPWELRTDEATLHNGGRAPGARAAGPTRVLRRLRGHSCHRTASTPAPAASPALNRLCPASTGRARLLPTASARASRPVVPHADSGADDRLRLRHRTHRARGSLRPWVVTGRVNCVQSDGASRGLLTLWGQDRTVESRQLHRTCDHLLLTRSSVNTLAVAVGDERACNGAWFRNACSAGATLQQSCIATRTSAITTRSDDGDVVNTTTHSAATQPRLRRCNNEPTRDTARRSLLACIGDTTMKRQ